MATTRIRKPGHESRNATGGSVPGTRLRSGALCAAILLGLFISATPALATISGTCGDGVLQAGEDCDDGGR